MIYKKQCSICGKIYDANTSCPCRYKTYDKTNRNKEATSFYNTKRWKTIRRLVLQRDKGIDQYTLHTRGKLVRGRTVHHIIERECNPSLAYTMSNLITVGESSHIEIHKLYDKDDKTKQATIKLLKSLVGGEDEKV